METPAPLTLGPARPDAPLRVVAVGSALLALPGVMGILALAYLLLMLVPIDDPWVWPNVWPVLLIIGGLLLAPVGFYLLAGYRRALRQGQPARRPHTFWWISAAYNAVGALLLASLSVLAVRVLHAVGPLGASLPLLAWTAFVAAFSASRALRAPAGTDE